MPFFVPPLTNEVDGLLGYLGQQRDALRASIHRLSAEQVSSRPVPSSELTPIGLVKHAATTEHHWIVCVMMRLEAPDPSSWAQQWSLADGETVDDVRAFYDRVAAETEEHVRGLPDLDFPVPVPSAPWFPKDVDHWSARWVLLHLIEETARHAGHADILREAIDGATCFPLLAAYDNDSDVEPLRF